MPVCVFVHPCAPTKCLIYTFFFECEFFSCMTPLDGTGRQYKRFPAGVITLWAENTMIYSFMCVFYFFLGRYEGDEAEATPH